MTPKPTQARALAEEIEREGTWYSMGQAELQLICRALRALAATVQGREGDADLIATIDKLVRIGGKKFPCFDEDDFMESVRQRFAATVQGRDAVVEKCAEIVDFSVASAAGNIGMMDALKYLASRIRALKTATPSAGEEK